MKSISSLLGSLLLLHTLLVAPLLIECVRADGQRLIELIGYDTCRIAEREAHSAEAHDPGVTSLSIPARSEDPCTDRPFEGPSYARIYSDPHISYSMMPFESAHSQSASCGEIACNRFEPVGKSPPLYGHGPSFPLNLRI